MAKKKKKKNGKLKTNGNVGGKADVHLSSNGGRNKSLLGHNAIFTPEVIDDIHIKSPPLTAAPKHDPAFFSITTFPAIIFSAHDHPTLPFILTTGPSIDPTPKYPRLPSKIKLSLFKTPTPRLCFPCGFFITIVP